MMPDPSPEQFRLVRILYKWRILIVFFTILVTIAAVLFSSTAFLTPLFKSEVIIYPPSTNSNRMLIERDARFGSDKEIDEQIQLLRSVIVRDAIIKKYKLYTHYQIDTLATDKRYRLYKIYDDRIKIDRTRYNSIAATVLDKNPVIAASMANDIITLGDKLRSDIIKSKLKEAFDALAATLFDISLDIDHRAEEINASFKNTVVSGSGFYKRNSLDQLKEQLDLKELMRQSRISNKPRDLEQLYFYESKLQQLSTIQLSYDQALVSLNNQIPSSFIISPAEIADKKSYPVRWIIILIAFASGFLGACIIALAVEKYKEFIVIVRQ